MAAMRKNAHIYIFVKISSSINVTREITARLATRLVIDIISGY
jgi:hypothetical protein